MNDATIENVLIRKVSIFIRIAEQREIKKDILTSSKTKFGPWDKLVRERDGVCQEDDIVEIMVTSGIYARLIERSKEYWSPFKIYSI